MNISEIFQLNRGLTSVHPETIFNIFGFPVANSTLFIILILLILVFLGIWSKRTFKEIPGKFQSFLEIVYEGIHTHISKIVGGEYHAKKVFPILGALFVFIGMSNYFGMIPLITSIQYDGMPIFRTPTTDFNTTLGLAFGAVLLIQFASIKDWGVFGHIEKYIPIKGLIKNTKENGVMGFFIGFINLFVGMLDIIGEIAHIASLSLRLFGNLYAGEILMAIFLGMFAYVLPGVIIGFGVLSSIVQTIVFGSLVAIYYTLAVKPEPKK